MNSFQRATLHALCLLLLPLAARAQSVTVIAHLGGNPNGFFPQTALVKGPDGTLYGTTASGGAANWGTVYKVSTAGKLTTIHTFPGGNGGSVPMAGLVFGKDGSLYGTTTRGGTAGNGTVFRVTPAGTATVLHSFSTLSHGTYGSNADGGRPQAGLLLGTDGNFYGTTPGGGAGEAGTVFKITPAGAFTTLHAFIATSTKDIFAPTTGLAEGTDGNFYGTAQGGDDNYDGAVFKMTPSGVVTVLHQFTGGKDGNVPGTLVRGKDGNFYGLTVAGGVLSGGAAANGTAFKITPAGALTTLHAFDAKVDGSNPAGALFQAADGDFYGAASGGGPANSTPYYGFGTIFKLTPAGALTVVYTFNYTSGINGENFNGETPMASVVQGSDGDFYGTTAGGGQGNAATNFYGDGTIFKLTASGTLTTLFRCMGGGAECKARLVESPEGNFYGTTERGGASNIGTIFGITPTGQVVTEYSFDDAKLGAYPEGGMVTDGAGNYYGFTGIDGPNGWGTLWKASEVKSTPPAQTPTMTVQNEIDNNLEGMVLTFEAVLAREELSEDAGGQNQGQAYHPATMADTLMDRFSKQRGGGASGSPGDDGAVMADTLMGRKGSGNATADDAPTASVPTVLYAFTGGKDGGEPLGAVYVDASENTFGTTSVGGANGQGTVYELTSGGTLRTLYSFKGKGDGAYPASGLIVGKDGNFYGTTEYATYDSTVGSSTGYGTVFKITPGGVLTTLHTFKDTPDGAEPLAELILGKDGNFYGTTSEGGTGLSGTVFKMTPAGTVTILHDFSPLDDEDSGPVAALIQSTDGSLYGTTYSSVFRVNTVPPVISSAATATATVGKAFSYQITASNGPTAFGVGGLFKGITVDKQTGLVSGTPTAAGKHTLTLQAQNAFGTGTKTLTLTVTN